METADSIHGKESQPLLPRESIRDLIDASIRSHPGGVAFMAPGRPDLTYADLGALLESTRRSLAGAGFTRGHRVALVLPHCAENALAIVAVMCAATCAPLSDELTEDDLARLLAAMRVDALILPEDGAPAAAAAARRLGIGLIPLRALPGRPAGMFELIPGGGRPPVEPCLPAPEDTALLTHTGGTTGLPKIVPLEHWRLAWGVRRRLQLSGIETSDRYLFAMPFRSMAAMRRGLLLALSAGASMICAPSHDTATLVDLLESAAPTLLMAPPVVLAAVADELARRCTRPHHALKYVISAFTSLSPQAARHIEKTIGVPVVVIYGTTEAGQIAQTPLPPETAPAGSVGWPYLHDVEIRDDSDRRLPPGEVGEIVVRGPEVFSGYEGNREASRAVVRGDWYRTGDTGYVDRQGFLFLADRVSDLVNRGGNKIAPGDIEDVLRKHAGVADAAAFGVSHPTLGQDVAVAVVPREPPPREAELRRFMRSRLAPYKLPSRYLLVPELPRTALGKIDRLKLRDTYEQASRMTFEEPRDGSEAVVARIFGEVLGLATVGRNDSFFDLGGDSLRVVSVLQELEKAFGIKPDFEALFDHPTVAAFAAVIDSQGHGGTAPIPSRTP